ncbi:hypothetical protein AWQ21_14600 (plasmid) [Picosynechococcus sp. PCC 7003]|uniref:GmrSD restriction endonuclease domain-containing protein n=1 Tax=Picosynechococcus sp. PCC 7003 TaxID=374981 RepID=UPI000810BFC6|nr:DUF262 domain-containing protein [Picosynechococcus sp. PCC 7003]ANV85761.1 hypothetical protein AWQ21_14600 [Picosynechococcus sp. PCC 7003]
MKAQATQLLKFLQTSLQLNIPIYQRTYSWEIKECQQLWDDIIRAGKSDKIEVHFIGSVVYIMSNESATAPLLIIDGQQRLTTISILLEALARELENYSEEKIPKGFSSSQIRGKYLTNPYPDDPSEKYKLILTQTDKDTWLSLLKNQDFPHNKSLKISTNFDFFTQKIRGINNNLHQLCKGLKKLMVVDIALDRKSDNPQLIFESMNSTGRELSQADLIRNFILMGLEPEQQTSLYENYWRRMELEFGQEAYSSYFDSFMRYYLTVKLGELPKKTDVYVTFKKLINSKTIDSNIINKTVEDLYRFSKYYCAIALGRETDKDLKSAFRDLRELKVDVCYPLLLELYADYQNKILSKNELLEATRLIESYVFRRAICSIPTNSLNKTFANFHKFLKKDRYLESIKARFLTLPSYRRFPNNEEFKRELKIRDLYNFRNRSYWLRRLENHNKKELVVVDEYTIEHIMPQNKKLSDEWQKVLGENWQAIQAKWLHTLGNLTLTAYNSEYSDRPFPEKRDLTIEVDGGTAKEIGFKYSPLSLNQGLGQIEEWTEDEIKHRAEKLSQKAIEVWVAPKLEQDVLDVYQEKDTNNTNYSVNDHPHLLSGNIKKLFTEFRKQVLDLDPCITEEFLKLYVAYKAETNFVDVVPQAKRLRLSLNMKFPEINDPKGLCKDVTNLGRWGNGDVEVGLENLEQLPYVIGLVRQSFEKQMNNSDDEI